MTFDGIQRLIILSEEEVSAKKVYSSWKTWVIQGNNAGFLPAISAIGGDPISDVMRLGATFFLENGWKIRPMEASHSLTLTGNLYTRDGSSPLTATLGNFNVLVSMARSNLVDTVVIRESGGSGATPSEIWNHSSRTLSAAGVTAIKSGLATSAETDAIKNNTGLIPALL